MACKYIYNNITYNSKEDFINKVIRDELGNKLLVSTPTTYSKEEYDSKQSEVLKQNSFMQLLSKDSNWVTFFVKSIISDSAKKGYEKVLFPSGDTASKVEGHETLEGYKKIKQYRLEEINLRIGTVSKNYLGFWALPNDYNPNGTLNQYDTKEKAIIGLNREKKQLEKELADIEGPQAFGALKPIYSFYENTVTNILNKNYGKENVKRITDEYGNTWNEVSIDSERDNSTIQFNRPITYQEQLNQLKERYHLVAIEKYGTKGYVMTLKGLNAIAEQFKKNKNLYNKLHLRYNSTIGVLEIMPNNFDDSIQMNRQEQEKIVATEIFDKVVGKMADKIGTSYQIITSEQAKELTKDSKIPYAGEKAFYYKGTAYILNTALTLNNGIHEVIHPFIDAIAINNPDLFNKIYSDLISTNVGGKIIREVAQTYGKDFDTETQKKEVIVRVLTELALNNIEADETSKVRSILSKIFFALKQMFRKLFAKTITLQTLNENTTLQELANMLTSDEFKIESKVVSENDIIQFKKDNIEIIDDLTKLTGNRLVDIVDKFSEIVKEHASNVSKYTFYSDVKDTTTPIGSRNTFLKMKNALDRAKLTTEDVAQAKELANTIGYAQEMTAAILDRLKEINEEPAGQESLSKLSYFGQILKDWHQFTDSLSKELSNSKLVNTNSALNKSIAQLTFNIEQGIYQITQNDEAATLQVLGTYLKDVRFDIQRKHQEMLATYEEDLAKGNQSAQSFIDKENKAFERLDLSDANLLKYLKGEMGDANWFSGVFEAYISNGDPIIGGFMGFLKTNLYSVQGEIRNFDNDFRNELNEDYKKAGINRKNPSELGKQTTFIDKVLEFVDGVATESQRITILNQFKDYRYDIDILEHKINIARATENKDDLAQLIKEKEELQNNYMHRQYIPEYYKLRDIWKTDIGAKAYAKRREILEDITERQDSLTDKPGERDDELKAIELLWREYSQLGTLSDLNGNMKKGEDLEIAEVIKEYNEQAKEFSGSVEIPNLFETRYNEYKQSLLDDGIKELSPEYKIKLRNWLNNNTQNKLTQSFYDDRQKILDRVSEILSKLPDAERKEVEVSAGWLSIIDQTKGFRDNNGQPIGSDMSEDKVAEIKKIQEDIIIAQRKYAKLSGLSADDADRLNELFTIKKSRSWTEEEREEIKELTDRKAAVKNSISKLEFIELFQLFDDLRTLQSKVPTNYYLEIMNTYLSKADHNLIDSNNAEDFLSENLDDLLNENPEFAKWFEKNHIQKERWDKDAKEMKPYFERLYVWNRIQPNNPKYIEQYELSDGTTLLGIPNNSYFRRVVKQQYHTGYNSLTQKVELKTGVHTDNKGHFLPKTVNEGAIDNKYINKDYDRLREEKPLIFNILQTFTKYHLKAQEGSYGSNKLWMDLPRYRRSTNEYLKSGKLAGDTKTKLQQIGSGIKATFATRKDDFTEGIGNFEDDIKGRLKTYDLFDNEIVRIPQTGLTHLPIDQVSLDIGGSIIRYASSAAINRKLVEINPIAKALINVVTTNGIKDLNGIKRKTFLTTGIKILGNQSKNKNVRAQILNNLYETIFEGKEHHMELGEEANKMINELMKLSAYGSLAFNVPGSVKNMVTANIQNFIETLGGASINSEEYLKGKMAMHSKFLPNMLGDYNKFADQTLETQLFRIFDPIQGKTEEKLGHEFVDANTRNLTNLHTSFFGMEAGEIEAQGSFWLGMMIHQKVNQTLNGVTKEITYKDAFEKIDGKIKLKEGIDEQWAEGGDKFNKFKLKMHELSQKMQGNYAKIDQPEMARYAIGAFASFMRRYFVPGITNRFSKDRVQVGIGSRREGYYRTFLRASQNTILNHKVNWHLYTTEEKGNIIKTTSEAGISLMLFLALRMIGWNEDDKDKYKKLKENSWATNHLIYQLMMVKSESEQFIPIPGMGGDEIIRMINTPSIALGHLSKWYRLFGDAGDYVGYWTGMNDGTSLELQQKQGFWEKGDNKGLMHIEKIIGITGASYDPLVGIKNFNLVQ